MFIRKVIAFSIVAVCLAPSVSSATESSAELINTEVLQLNGENFELQTWTDSNGEEYQTIPTDLEDKNSVSEFMERESINGGKISTLPTLDKPITRSLPNLIITDPVVSDVITPQATFSRFYWSKSLSNTDYSGKVNWSTGGYSELAYLKPATADKLHVSEGNIKVTYTGSGVPDKIVSSYSYVFSGLTIGLSYPPTLSASSNTVSWKSQPITKQIFVSHKTHWAEGTSRTALYKVTLSAAADIYKGSYIYRPRAVHTKYWGS